MASTVLIIALSIGLLLLFLVCLMGPKEVWDIDSSRGILTELTRRKNQLLRVIKDLEQERENGAIDGDEFARLRNNYKMRAIGVMRELDRVRAARIRRLDRRSGALPPSLERKIESLVQERRKSGMNH